MNIYIHSCHATLEYDQAELLVGLGHHVSGRFDVGSKERPKLPGVTDKWVEFPDIDTDVVLLHQCDKFPEVMLEYLKQGQTVILSVFGQGSPDQHRDTAQLCKDYPQAHVMPYSRKDERIYRMAGTPPGQCHYIPFCKDLSVYQAKGGWTGNLPVCYISCNNIHNRGEGCGWAIVQGLKRWTTPLLLGGSATEETFWGVGQLSYEGRLNLLRQVRCCLVLGTAPAPYTLGLVEAVCAGTPVVVYDNGDGFDQEGWELASTTDIKELAPLIQDALAHPAYGHMLSERLQKTFDKQEVSVAWEIMLKEARNGNGK